MLLGGIMGSEMSRPVIGVIACLLALVLLGSACGSSSSTKNAAAASNATIASAGAPRNGGSLVIGIDAETDSWNPATAEWAAEGSLVGSSVLEPLAKLNSRGGADPYLATAWIADANFDRWLIKLRPNVQFQDGEPFNAAAVKLNLDTYVNGALSGQVLKPLIKDVEVQDNLTVVVNMLQPWAAFPSSYLDGNSALMMAPAMIHSPDGGASHPIGTGPFTFESWVQGSTFTAVKNQHYWQKGLPHLNSIEFKVIPDETTRVAALQSGDINMMLTKSAADANSLASSFTVVKDWDTEPTMVDLNTLSSINGKANPFSDVHARLAVAYATKSSTVARQLGAGVQTASSPWAPNNTWGMPTSQNGWVTYDPAKARQELAQYEQDSGQSSLTFTLDGTPDLDTQRTLQQLQAEWKQVGIVANLQTLDQVSLIKQLVASNFQAMLAALYNYPDPDTESIFWTSATATGEGGVNINFINYKNPQIDADLVKGRTSGYPSVRKAAYDDLVHQLNSAAVNDWVYFTPYSFVAQHTVHGLQGAQQVPFGNYQPKTWLADLWVSTS